MPPCRRTTSQIAAANDLKVPFNKIATNPGVKTYNQSVEILDDIIRRRDNEAPALPEQRAEQRSAEWDRTVFGGG